MSDIPNHECEYRKDGVCPVCYRIAELEAKIVELVAQNERLDMLYESAQDRAKQCRNKLRACKKRMAKLEAIIYKMRPLVQEIIDIHADPDCAEYNECDTDPCMWCEQMKAALEQTNEQ